MKNSTIVFAILKRVHLRSARGPLAEQFANTVIAGDLMELHKKLYVRGE